jgi:hypothetical protein
MLRLSHTSRALGLLVLASVAACTAPTEDTGSDESDIRKRINPSSGSAAFELKKPAWYTDAFLSEFTFAGSRAELGKRYERAPGEYPLVSGILYLPTYYGFGTRQYSMQMQVPLELGMISIYEPAGLVIKYDRPINAGKNVISGKREQVQAIAIRNEELKNKPDGYSLAMLDGRYEIETSANEKQTVDVAEGQKKDVLLPTASLDFRYETIDPEFPGTTTCLGVTYVAENARIDRTSDTLAVARDRQYVVPAGSFAQLRVGACGKNEVLDLAPGATHTITVHRLEVNDLDIVDPDGQHRIVRGTFKVERKHEDGNYTTVLSSQPTHTGVDVTDGTYRVTSTAPNAPPHVQEITFP